MANKRIFLLLSTAVLIAGACGDAGRESADTLAVQGDTVGMPGDTASLHGDAVDSGAGERNDALAQDGDAPGGAPAGTPAEATSPSNAGAPAGTTAGAPSGTAADLKAALSPGEARIVATVIAVDEARASSGPCAAAPCTATVRIDSVLGYGSAFPRPLSDGEEIEARFAFTLAPTAEADLEIDASYPGLRAGDTFRADVQGRSVPGGISFVVYAYHRNE